MKLPDVALETHLKNTPLDWVGMEGIRLPLSWDLQGAKDRLPPVSVLSEVSAYVSLDLSESRGIHMSRLYLSVQKLSENPALTWKDLEFTLQEFLEHHRELSRSARLVLEFQMPLQRRSLKSQISSWKTYPFKIDMEKVRDGQDFQKAAIQFCVEYSSTCPASAALAREAQRENFRAHFQAKSEISAGEIEDFLSSSQGLFATPHAQRSLATVTLNYKNLNPLSFSDVIQKIDGVESALKTPVQGAVKRVDELEFAKLNGQNTMFCEDAARRISAYFESQSDLENYLIKVEHFESLHPHNAVAFARKNKK